MIREYAPPSSSRPRLSPDGPYARAERMLTQYGLSYVCANPGLLLGYLTPSGRDLGHLVATEGGSASSLPQRREYQALLARRSAEAYRALQCFYTPYRPRR